MQENFSKDKCQGQKKYASVEVYTPAWLMTLFFWDITKHYIPEEWSPEKNI
jgi:hypothetical protein